MLWNVIRSSAASLFELPLRDVIEFVDRFKLIRNGYEPPGIRRGNFLHVEIPHYVDLHYGNFPSFTPVALNAIIDRILNIANFPINSKSIHERFSQVVKIFRRVGRMY